MTDCEIQGKIEVIDQTIKELQAKKEQLKKELETPYSRVARLYEGRLESGPKNWCGESSAYWFSVTFKETERGDYYNDYHESELKKFGLKLTAVTHKGKTLIFGKLQK